ncbi:DUF11 domain-containing protein [Streptomyces sp. NPDC004533]|uniref:DUF11 domain-containing protein n=1 Tax=Streptomyces sp. NPDC004533 TaxID=3154278 RepID=UPI0033ADE9D4
MLPQSLGHLAAVSVVVIAGVAVPTPAQAQALTPSQAGTADQHGKAAKTSKAKKSKRAAQPGTPFACTGKIYESAGTPMTQLYEGTPGLGSVSFAPLGPASGHYNAIGINPVDHFMYGIDNVSDSLLRMSNDGSVTNLGSITGLPSHGFNSYNSGTFDNAGNFYVAHPLAGRVTEIYMVDVTTHTATRTIPVIPSVQFSDLVFAEGFLWSASPDGHIIRIDPNTGVASTFSGVLPRTTLNGYGGAFTYGNGDLGIVDNGGFIRRVAVANPGSATPTFTVLPTQTAPAVSTNVDATSCFGAPTDLSVTKTSVPAAYTPGQKVTYTITVKNNGPNQSSGYALTDTIPAGLTSPATSTAGCTVTGSTLSCTRGALAVGALDAIIITGTVDKNFTGDLSDTATVTGNEADTNPKNSTATLDTPRARGTDLGIAQAGPAKVTEGDSVTYTLKVTNNGPNDSTGYTVTDSLPAALRNASTTTPGCTISGSTVTCTGAFLAAGASNTITIKGTVGPGTTALTNTASVTGRDIDPNPGNNTNTISSPRTQVDLALQGSGPARVSAGDQVSYNIKVTNNGPNDSTGYTVTDSLPAALRNASTTTPGCTISGSTVTCTGAFLAAGASNTITIKGTVGPGTTALTNTASVTGRDIDPNPGNNTNTISSPRTQVDLALQGSGPARVSAGDQVSYNIKVTNNGPNDSTGYTVTDSLPAALRNASTTTPGCTISGSTVTCTGAFLAAGDSVTITVTGTAARNAPCLTSTAAVVGKDIDPDPGNNVETLTIDVEHGKGKHGKGKHGKGKHGKGKQ